MPWVNTQTGQTSNMSPDWTGGSYSNTQWVDPPATPQAGSIDLSNFNQPNRSVTSMDASASSPVLGGHYGNPRVYAPAPRVQTQFEKDMRRALRLFAKAALVLLVAGVALGLVGYIALNRFNHHWTAKNAGGPMVFSQSELNLRSTISSWRGNPTFLTGREVIVDADIKGKNVFAYQDMTVKGDISNSKVSATLGALTVGNVENSTLTAHKIVVTGIAKNTKQVILPSARVAPVRGMR